jgi:hypothetical protein
VADDLASDKNGKIASTHRGRGHVQRVGPLPARQARRFTAEILARS